MASNGDVEWLLDGAKRQLAASGNIDGVLAAFAPVLNEFEAYVEGISVPQLYRSRLTAVTGFLKSTFGLATTVMLVQTNKYTADMWGPLYWTFLHYASILLQYALYTGLADDLKDFPLLVYNVDKMLPCGVCVAHYLGIKRRTDVRYLVRLMSFGHLVQGVYQFHNLVAENVHGHRHNSPQAASKFRPFTPIDFAKRYGCYPLTTTVDAAHKTSTYVRCPPDWQTPLHVGLSVVLFLDRGVSYHRVSNYLKRVYNGGDASAEELHPRPAVFTVEDERFERETTYADLCDSLRHAIATGKPKRETEDELVAAYAREAVETLRAALSGAGRRSLLATAKDAVGTKPVSV